MNSFQKQVVCLQTEHVLKKRKKTKPDQNNYFKTVKYRVIALVLLPQLNLLPKASLVPVAY